MAENNIPRGLRKRLRLYFLQSKQLQRNRFFSDLATEMSPALRREVYMYNFGCVARRWCAPLERAAD